jgi:hypothetical protein
MEIIKIIGEYIKNFADTLIQSIKKTKEKNNKLLKIIRKLNYLKAIFLFFLLNQIYFIFINIYIMIT